MCAAVRFAIAFIGLLSVVSTASADVLRIPVGQQQADISANLPATGTSKTQVEQRYGDPAERSGPVGEPSIYRWDYPEFTVYFENDRVIHAVVKFVAKHNSGEQ
ncbi:MAG TPA: hypothetical protein VIC08_08130 [Cellvibrionaceae bacterium]